VQYKNIEGAIFKNISSSFCSQMLERD